MAKKKEIVFTTKDESQLSTLNLKKMFLEDFESLEQYGIKIHVR